ncbi:MAG: YihY/virulence factor BrkB family protein [Microbacter sp.]
MLRIGIVTFEDWTKGPLNSRASALTYFSLFSIVPVFALLFGIAKGFGLDRFLEKWMTYNLVWAGDALPVILNFTDSLLEHTKGGLIAGVGLIFLFYAVINMLGRIEDAMNDIHHIEKKRSIIRKFTDYSAIMALAPLFLLVSSAAQIWLYHTLRTMTDPLSFNGFLRPLFRFIPYVMSWILFACLYIIMPNDKVKIKPALIAALIAGTLFQFWQYLYVNFQIGVAQYNAIYGSFAALPLLLLFLYYSWVIFLVGGKIAYSIEHIHRIQIERSSGTWSIFQQKILYTLLVHAVVKRFEFAKEPPNVETLAFLYKLPEHLVKKMLQALVDARVLLEVNVSPVAYIPAFDIHKMTIGYLLRIIEQTIDAQGNLQQTGESKIIETIYNDHLYSLSEANRLIKDITN